MARGTNRKSIALLADERGFLSIDFLFAMVMAGVLCILMFAFTTTLSMIEVAQYIAFSTSRAHLAAHTTQERQVALAEAKFKSFTKSSAFPSLSVVLLNDWFELDPKSLQIKGGGNTSVGSPDQTFNDLYGYVAESLPQMGVRFRLNAKILKLNLPLLGSLTAEEDFGTWITALLLREPTSEECEKSFAADVRYSAIKKLDTENRFSRAVSNSLRGDESYFPMEDNGC